MEVSSHYLKQTLTYWAELGTNLCKTSFAPSLQLCRVALRYNAIAKNLLDDCRCLDSVLYGLKEAHSLAEFHPEYSLPECVLSAISKLKQDEILLRIEGQKKEEIFKTIQTIELIALHQEAGSCLTQSGAKTNKNVLDSLNQPNCSESRFLEVLSFLTSDDAMCIDEVMLDTVSERLVAMSNNKICISSDLSKALTHFYLQSFHDAAGAGMILTMLGTDLSEKCTFDDKIYCEQKLIEWLELRALMNSSNGLYQEDFSHQIYLLMSPMPFEPGDGVDFTEFVLHRLSQRNPDLFPSSEQKRALQAYLKDQSSEK
jgi:hypothetical protein